MCTFIKKHHATQGKFPHYANWFKVFNRKIWNLNSLHHYVKCQKSYQYHHQENSSCQLSYQNQHQKNVECQLGYYCFLVIIDNYAQG